MGNFQSLGRLKCLSLLCGGAAIVAALMSSVLSVVSSAKAADARAVLIDTFDSPLYIASAPGHPRLLFVVEQTGRIQVLRDEVQLDHPFLDISGIISTGGERGLLSVAFPPNYDTSGRFYVAFTNSSGALEVDEFKRRAGDPTRADPATRRIVLTVPHPGAANHNGGQLQFGPRDGSSISRRATAAISRRPANRRAILRTFEARYSGSTHCQRHKPYRIPRSNPFVGRPGRDEIYAYGLRNPWRFSFDGRRLIIADVGRDTARGSQFPAHERVAGVNFGWPQYEGNIVFDDTRPGPHPPTFPIFTYSHGGGRCAVIGGYVVHDPICPTFAIAISMAISAPEWCAALWRMSRVSERSPTDQLE